MSVEHFQGADGRGVLDAPSTSSAPMPEGVWRKLRDNRYAPTGGTAISLSWKPRATGTLLGELSLIADRMRARTLLEVRLDVVLPDEHDG